MHNNNDQHEAKAAENARRAAETKAAEDARRAAQKPAGLQVQSTLRPQGAWPHSPGTLLATAGEVIP